MPTHIHVLLEIGNFLSHVVGHAILASDGVHNNPNNCSIHACFHTKLWVQYSAQSFEQKDFLDPTHLLPNPFNKPPKKENRLLRNTMNKTVTFCCFAQENVYNYERPLISSFTL